MESLVRQWLGTHRLGTGVNLRIVEKAWHQATGAGRYTSKLYLRDGRLYVTMSSSVARSQLSFQKPAILEKMNAIIAGDPLCTAATTHIKELIIR